MKKVIKMILIYGRDKKKVKIGGIKNGVVGEMVGKLNVK